MGSESIETVTSWEEEYQVYKNYLFPQWNTVLTNYIAAYKAKVAQK